MPRRWDYHWEFWVSMVPDPEPVPEPRTPPEPQPSLWQIEKRVNRIAKEVAKRTGQRYLFA
jgi:hypothetical protein